MRFLNCCPYSPDVATSYCHKIRNLRPLGGPAISHGWGGHTFEFRGLLIVKSMSIGRTQNATVTSGCWTTGCKEGFEGRPVRVKAMTRNCIMVKVAGKANKNEKQRK